ncbi:myo-inositol-1(or 4)-monophosphatase [Ligilactobacillus acidipiscis DSM 15836]|uniref:Myo-inositol-1(Or 4)-monophosphatase n=2 Tax=Ligilactobacillus acidipiscis TaxID=89059 RepID=A0A0R2KI93_9LACO|nr:inositol monophosphatase family protein [Ligilactobacillus acidipiscis]KRM24116.1 myo-inositol-1(or 4)-monophosphatase [Ligilactobacillus acidipiscis DSM 15836]KRN87068.1 myo-inositol-1(or 4)-monophosphatase [Ligilactobacillus acidipiscis]GAW63807.1 inositol monophosphatase [Ligilactobacillus acidipiscis]GEN21795.1 myo-inositol-1(or 4)-monophosphatase [Ligilactobacillus acidipiscis]
MTEQQKEIYRQVTKWFHEARNRILEGRARGLDVQNKTSRLDLVTNIDKEIERFFREKINENFSDSAILGEEGNKADFKSSKGLFWVIDPIDGTMNFVKQAADFASMIAIYQDQKPLLGFIYDVIHDRLYWGGPGIGVYCNKEQLPAPKNIQLKDGLLGVNGPMMLTNYHNLQEVIRKSAGARIYGSAGIEFIHVLTGQCVGYLSHLRPWDYAAGSILAESLNLSVKTIDGKLLDVVSSEDVLVATKNAYIEISALMSAK